MAGPASARRGQPLIALMTVLLGWTAVRMLIWTPSFEPVVLAQATGMSTASRSGREFGVGHGSAGASSIAANGEDAVTGSAFADNPRHRRWWDKAVSGRHGNNGLDPANFTSFRLLPGKVRSGSGARSGGRGSSLMGSLQAGGPGRWSADGWLLLRGAGGDAAQAPGAASYGASQAGAVLRYRLGDGGANNPYAYMRASSAINAPGSDREAAVGLGIRPFAGLPLRALAEVRAQDSSVGSLRVRPVVAVITELPWQELPLGMRGEVYAQGGYVGGREGTAFFDAQALVDRPVGGLLPQATELRIGAGVWAGGQRDAVRVDIGPRVTLGVNVGARSSGRVALDWRFRVGGNARPGSGPALTVASSF